MAYILSCIIVFRRWTKPFIYGFFLLFFFLETFLLVFFGFHISAKLLTLLYETTPNESSEFIKTFLFSWDFSLFVSIAVLLVCAIIFLEKLYKRYKNKIFTERLCVYIGGCVFLLLLTSVFYGRTYVDLLNMHTTDEVCIWSGNKFCNPNDPFTNLLAACRSVSVSSNEMEREVIATENAGGKIVSDDSLNVVFVIGESFIKYHSSVYGYYLQTTPNMQKERDRGNLFVFNNVMSPYNYTSAAIRNMMSTNSLSDGENGMISLISLQYLKMQDIRSSFGTTKRMFMMGRVLPLHLIPFFTSRLYKNLLIRKQTKRVFFMMLNLLKILRKTL